MQLHVNWFIALLCNTAVVLCCVLFHYEALNFLSNALQNLRSLSKRTRVLVGVLGAMTAHVIEVWFFGVGYYFLSRLKGFGELLGSDESLLDCVYFSLVSYTSLGYGDIAPTAYLRFLAGVEALTGLVLIAWSSSMTFIWMQRFWNKKKSKKKKKTKELAEEGTATSQRRKWH